MSAGFKSLRATYESVVGAWSPKRPPSADMMDAICDCFTALRAERDAATERADAAEVERDAWRKRADSLEAHMVDPEWRIKGRTVDEVLQTERDVLAAALKDAVTLLCRASEYCDPPIYHDKACRERRAVLRGRPTAKTHRTGPSTDDYHADPPTPKGEAK